MSARVAVLMGGWSAEREVSLASGRACAAALRTAGFQVTEVDVDQRVATVLSDLRPDVCFNALHGPIGEDGSIQGLLNVLGIPYTHSGVQASALAMDKPRAKALFASGGLRCPPGVICSPKDAGTGHCFDPPYVIKPINQGSSVGVRIVRPGDNRPRCGLHWDWGDRVLVEPYIPGRELTVGVLDGEPLCVTEITSDRVFYDYDAKYQPGGSVHLLPAPVGDDITEQVLSMAVQAHELLGCRGITRSDFRLDDTGPGAGALFLLETNTQPGMTATSLVPEQAAHCGMHFSELVARMVEAAQCDP